MGKNGFGGSDFLYIGIGVAAVYAAWKWANSLTGGIKQTGDAVGNIAGTTADTVDRYGEALGSYADIWNTGFDRLNEWLKNANFKKDEKTKIGETPDGKDIFTYPKNGENMTILPPGYYKYEGNFNAPTTSYKAAGKATLLPSKKEETITLKSGSTISSKSIFAASALKAGATISGDPYNKKTDATFSKTGTINNPFKSGIFKK